MNIIEYGKNELMKFIIILIVIFNKEWSIKICLCLFTVIDILYYIYFYTPRNEVVGGILVSPCPSVCRQILCRVITWVVLKFWNFISSLPMKRGGSLSFLTIFTFAVPELLDLIWRKIGFLPCRMITWVVFLRMFWNLPVKRGESISFLKIFTFADPESLDLIWRKIGFLPYVVW